MTIEKNIGMEVFTRVVGVRNSREVLEAAIANGESQDHIDAYKHGLDIATERLDEALNNKVQN